MKEQALEQPEKISCEAIDFPMGSRSLEATLPDGACENPDLY